MLRQFGAQPLRVTVYGSGLMGAGICQVLATKNHNVTLVDVSLQNLSSAQSLISSSLVRVAKKKYPESPSNQQEFISGIKSRIKTSTDGITAAKDSQLIVEAIVENLETKRALIRSIVSSVDDKDAIFVSNTSSLPIHEIAEAVGDNFKSRFAGLHFFNPVPQMKLVEVVKAKNTSQEVVDDLVNLCKSIDKVPVKCSDTPGLLVPYLMEAVRMMERGEASKEDIDTAMKLGAGYPMGPFELMDYVGLDTLKFICDGWYESSEELKGDALVRPSKTVTELVQQKMLGRKTGKGFYLYNDKLY